MPLRVQIYPDRADVCSNWITPINKAILIRQLTPFREDDFTIRVIAFDSVLRSERYIHIIIDINRKIIVIPDSVKTKRTAQAASKPDAFRFGFR